MALLRDSGFKHHFLHSIPFHSSLASRTTFFVKCTITLPQLIQSWMDCIHPDPAPSPTKNRPDPLTSSRIVCSLQTCPSFTSHRSSPSSVFKFLCYCHQDFSFFTKIKMSTSTHASSPFSSDASPYSSFLTHHYTEKFLNLTDIKYEESYMRTPMPDLRWKHEEPALASSVVDGWELGEDEDEDLVVESIEVIHPGGRAVQGQRDRKDVWGDGNREWSPPYMSKKRTLIEDDDEDEQESHRKNRKSRKVTS
jgi:hypothetical protein